MFWSGAADVYHISLNHGVLPRLISIRFNPGAVRLTENATQWTGTGNGHSTVSSAYRARSQLEDKTVEGYIHFKSLVTKLDWIISGTEEKIVPRANLEVTGRAFVRVAIC
ncbi:hypothetical protein RRG08_037990 [Elysia crispata]|uniref:Uncharacterized protein n=1 Tax=Elysia crispata TaxID=231223 RepID=A0AAE1DXD2_9GAST|nr:hypothetical protein RRG08_037990 [Elysia crispata]